MKPAEPGGAAAMTQARLPEAPQVDVIVEDDGWGDPTALVTAAVGATLAHLGLDPAGYEVGVLCAGDERIRALNAEFRGQDKPTNVLSWPAVDLLPETSGAAPEPPEPGRPEDPVGLGDIALALGVCHAEAAAAGKPFAQHLSHLVVHATLHLLGHDHETEADADLMETRERAILAGLGIPDPYGSAPGNSTEADPADRLEGGRTA